MSYYVMIESEFFESSAWLGSTPEQKTVLITIIAMVNHTPKQWEWKGRCFELQRGQLITSLDSLMKKCGKGVSLRKIRIALERFEKLEILTNESTKTGRLITLTKFRRYEHCDDECDKAHDKDMTKRRQRHDKEAASNKYISKKELSIKELKETNTPPIPPGGVERVNGIPFNEIITYLNEKTGKAFRVETPKTKLLIKARWNEGFKLQEFKRVIETKAMEWKNDPERAQYLRPETLFGNKFEGYLNQEIKQKKSDWY